MKVQEFWEGYKYLMKSRIQINLEISTSFCDLLENPCPLLIIGIRNFTFSFVNISGKLRYEISRQLWILHFFCEINWRFHYNFQKIKILSNRRVRKSTFKERKSRYEIGCQKFIEMLNEILIYIWLHIWMSAGFVVVVVEFVLVLLIRSTFDLFTKTSVLSYTTLA